MRGGAFRSLTLAAEWISKQIPVSKSERAFFRLGCARKLRRFVGHVGRGPSGWLVERFRLALPLLRDVILSEGIDNYEKKAKEFFQPKYHKDPDRLLRILSVVLSDDHPRRAEIRSILVRRVMELAAVRMVRAEIRAATKQKKVG